MDLQSKVHLHVARLSPACNSMFVGMDARSGPLAGKVTHKAFTPCKKASGSQPSTEQDYVFITITS